MKTNNETKNETKKLAYSILAKNMYAKRPDEVPSRQWAGVKSSMLAKYRKEWMGTPEGLYTDAQIWQQTFSSLIG